MAHARDSLSLWMCEKDMFCVCAVYLRENQHVMEAMNNKTVKDARELNILYTYTEHHIIYTGCLPTALFGSIFCHRLQ